MVAAQEEPPTFHIAGPAGSLEFAQAEYLAELLMRNLPDISCRIQHIHPDDWREYSSELCRARGFPDVLVSRQGPIAWTGTGHLVGGATEFNTECRKKYDLTFDGAYSADTWKAITAENLAEADLRKRTKTARARGECVPHAPPARGQGAALGLEAVAELLDGARRLQRGERKDWAEVPLGSADVPRICVLAPKGYGVSVHSLFDTLPSSLFVVESPCSAPTADAVEGVLYGLNELRCNALVIFGSMQSAELDTVMAVAKAKATGALHALSPAERVWAEPMSEVALSLLQTAPPALSEGGLRVACMEGWLHSIDQRFSTVLEASVALVRHRELHIACVMADHGNVRLV